MQIHINIEELSSDEALVKVEIEGRMEEQISTSERHPNYILALESAQTHLGAFVESLQEEMLEA